MARRLGAAPSLSLNIAAGGASREVAVLARPSGTGARTALEPRRLMPALLSRAMTASTALSPALLSLRRRCTMLVPHTNAESCSLLAKREQLKDQGAHRMKHLACAYGSRL